MPSVSLLAFLVLSRFSLFLDLVMSLVSLKVAMVDAHSQRLNSCLHDHVLSLTVGRGNGHFFVLIASGCHAIGLEEITIGGNDVLGPNGVSFKDILRLTFIRKLR